jgi:O-antigen/teichoic acid export membrane protein
MADDAHSMPSTAAALALATLVAMALGLIRNKYVATALGPDGIGILGQLATYQATARAVVLLGLPGAAAREIARARGAGAAPAEAEGTVISTALSMTAATGLLGAGLTYFGAQALSNWTLGGLGDGSRFLRIVSPAILLLGVNAVILGVFQGYRLSGHVAWLNISLSAAALLSTIPLVRWLGLSGAVVEVPVATGLVTCVSLVLLVRHGRRRGLHFSVRRIPRALALGMIAVGLATSIAAVGDSASLLFTRSWLVTVRGVQDNGYLQAAWAMSSYYLAIVVGTLSTYAYPRINERNTLEEMRAVVNEALNFNIAVLGPVLMLVAGAATLVIPLLYNQEFLQAAPVLGLKALGDGFFVAKWCFGLPLIARGRLKAYVILNLLDNLALIAVGLWAIPAWGALGGGAAYLGCNVFGVAINYVYQRQTLGLRVDGRNLRLAGICLAVLAVVLLAGARPALSAALGAAGAIGWLVFVPETAGYLRRAVAGLVP